MRIRVVGKLSVEDGGALVRERDLPGNQGRLVLAMLAVERRHPLSRDQLADELWPGGLPPSWETALPAVVSKLRAALGRAGLPPRLIESAFGCYQLHAGAATVDVEFAAAALHRAEDELRRGSLREAAASATATCIVCRRPFLPGLYNPWTLEQRERVRALHARARRLLAEAHGGFGDWIRAAEHAERAIELDPYHERSHQHLIHARARSGDRLGAARVFERYRRLMEDELGVEPSAATVSAYTDALRQEPAPQ